jgi:hypothetical protein
MPVLNPQSLTLVMSCSYKSKGLSSRVSSIVAYSYRKVGGATPGRFGAPIPGSLPVSVGR